MLKGPSMAWLLACIAILAIGGIVALSLPRPVQQIHNQAEPTANNQQTNPKKSEAHGQDGERRADVHEQQNYLERFIASVEARDKFIVAASTVVIAIFTLALFVATGLLFYSSEKVAEAAKDSAEVAGRTLHQSQRSWVTVDAIRTTGVANYDKGFLDFTFEIEMVNSGGGLAKDIRIKAVILPASTGSGDDAYLEKNWDKAKGIVEAEIGDNKQGWPIGYVLAPQQKTIVPHPGAAPEVTRDQAVAGQFRIIGYISYVDQFEKPHFTWFGYRPITPITDGSPKFVADGRFAKAD